jgi:hypothetical protein
MPSVSANPARIEMDSMSLAMLLGGIDIERVKRPLPWTPPV